MDRAYEGNETRNLIYSLKLKPVVPPHPQRLRPWKYNRRLDKKRNEVERLIRIIKGFRRVFTRFDKLDSMFTAFIHVALLTDGLCCLNRP
jgi:transposase